MRGEEWGEGMGGEERGLVGQHYVRTYLGCGEFSFKQNSPVPKCAKVHTCISCIARVTVASDGV